VDAAPISRLGSYIVESRIASGGMGEVYRGTAIGPDGVQKPVAIKLVRDHLLREPWIVDMFVEEAKVAFLLTHPNIVQTYELGQVDGHYFLVMEYVAGLSLEKLLDHSHRRLNQPLPLSIVLYIAARIARGLAYAHELCDQQGTALGIVHRDVSPGNILLADDGQVKLVDFGLAKSVLRRGESIAGGVKGKLAYMAPEQLRGEQLDARADIYALGITLFEMLSGKNPFGPPGEVTLHGRLYGESAGPRLTELANHVEPPIPALVARCLAEKSSERFESARAFGRELDRCVAELGLTLSDYDVADFVAAARVASDGSAPVGPDPFDRALGMELKRLAVTHGVGTFATVSSSRTGGAGTAEPSSSQRPAAPAAAPAVAPPQPASNTKIVVPVRRGALFASLLAIAVSLVAIGLWITQRGTAGGTNEDRVSSEAGPSRGESDSGPTAHLHPTAPRRPEAGTPPAVTGPAETAVSPRAGDAKLAQQPATRRIKRIRRRAKRQTGLISLNSVPWSIVYLDGKRLRSTPLVGYRVRAGKHRVRLVNPAKGLERTIRLDVAPQQHVKRSVRLAAEED
jgi:serine/threonine protein kinase